MKKKTSKSSDLILNMLPPSQRKSLPVPKPKKKSLTEIGATAVDATRARASLKRSYDLGILQAGQFTAPISNGLVLPTGEQVSSITASKKSGDATGFNITAANTATMMPFFHTPGNAQDAYNLPKTYVEQIRWSRLMYNLNAYIGAITDLKAFYALSKFKLVTSEPAITEFYAQVAFNKNFNLYDFILRMSLNYQKFGEAIAWGARKQAGTWPKTGQPIWVWDYFIMLEPELVEIRKPLVGSHQPKYYLRPSRDMEELVNKIEANDPEYMPFQNQIPESLREKIKKKDLIQLDENTVSAIQNLTDASATRGTPTYQRLFTTFILEDFTRLAQMAQANRYHFPMELWTLGDLEKNILPNTADLEKLRDLVTDAIQQPPFSLFLPPIVKYEALGVQGKTFPFQDDYNYIWQQYMVGMGVSSNLILGEALALDTPIPTPSGWTTMGELEVGDDVFASDGSVTKVVAKSQVWENRPTYSVKIDGSAPIFADENHKWVIRKRRNKDLQIMTTKELATKTLKVAGALEYRVPVAGPLNLDDISLPIPAYTLGAWLGDGNTSADGKFTCHENDKEIVEAIQKEGVDIVKIKGHCMWSIRGLREIFRNAGLAGNKHIPPAYLRASYNQRLSLLHGLMDTDGTCLSNTRQSRFSNTNYSLVASVRELLLTLGYKPGTIIEDDAAKKSYGESAKTCFHVSFSVGDGLPSPFLLKRKAKAAAIRSTAKNASSRTKIRSVQSVELVPSVPTVCIQVAHPSGTFLAGKDFIVTHNSGIFSSADTSSNQAFIRYRKKERDQLEDWMTWHFFEPLARWNNLRIKKGNQLVPILPDYEWEKTLDFTAEEQEREDAKFLWEKGVYPTKGLLGKLRKNPEEVEKALESELDTIFDDGKRIAAPAIRKKKKDLGEAGLPGPSESGGGVDEEGPTGETPETTTGPGAAPTMVPETGEAAPTGVAPAAEVPAPAAEPAVTEAPEIL